MSTRAYPWTYPREDARDLFIDLALADAASLDAQTIACLLPPGPISRATQSMAAALGFLAGAFFAGAFGFFLDSVFRGTMPYLTLRPFSLRTMTGPV